MASKPALVSAVGPAATGRDGQQPSKHTILMVTDFFFPGIGGVESHVYQLSQQLRQMGHSVVVMTHCYGSCGGLRLLANGLKVYYVYRRPFYQQSTFPTLFGSLGVLREVLQREAITMVHAHQAFSTLGLEACFVARTMGYKVVFTDHSLFGFADAASIVMNKVLKCVLADVHHAICVSHTSKENTVLRACLPPIAVSVIPNAVDTSQFMPAADGMGQATKQAASRATAVAATTERGGAGSSGSLAPTPSTAFPSFASPARTAGRAWGPGTHLAPSAASGPPPAGLAPPSILPQGPALLPRPPWPRNQGDPVVVVALSRLVYRKGIDLLALLLPHACRRYPNLRFVIGGDGPKRALLERTVFEHRLAGQVTLAGRVPNERVRDFLLQGHVFINCSLTEAFCMAIVEAASAGLLVVSTRVGGVPEVLPSPMTVLAEPAPSALATALETALTRVSRVMPHDQHLQVSHFYNWRDVATRTVQVYDAVADSQRDDCMLARLARYTACGAWAGTAFAAAAVVAHLYWQLLEAWERWCRGLWRHRLAAQKIGGS